MISLDTLNTLSPDEFVATLTGIFEHTDWIAARAADKRPFDSPSQLLRVLQRVLAEANEAEQLALIRAHPALAARSVRTGSLTDASTSEQRRAGLEGCTPPEAARLQELNAAYLAKFGFPFILAVRGHDPESIIARCEQRLGCEMALERVTALEEIGRIAGFRLAERISP